MESKRSAGAGHTQDANRFEGLQAQLGGTGSARPEDLPVRMIDVAVLDGDLLIFRYIQVDLDRIVASSPECFDESGCGLF